MKKWYWIFVVLLAICLPLGLNWLILQPKRFEVIGNDTHWLSFWVTYISAIASFAMVYITWKTLILNQKVIDQNKEQLDELKRQWKEQNRPRLSFSVVRKENLYYIRVSNIGSVGAFGIDLNFDETYFDEIDDLFCKYYPKSKFSLDSNKSQYLPMCNNTLQDKDSFLKNRDTIRINGSYNNSYRIDETLLLSEYMQFEKEFDFDTALVEIKGFEKIKTGFIQNSQPRDLSIQKSLNIIADKIDKINIEDNDTK